jgi:hypothetical protein
MARNKLKKKGILSIATWNVRGIAFKEDQLDDIIAKKNIKIAAISETKKKIQRVYGNKQLSPVLSWNGEKGEGSSWSNANDSQNAPKHYRHLHLLE